MHWTAGSTRIAYVLGNVTVQKSIATLSVVTGLIVGCGGRVANELQADGGGADAAAAPASQPAADNASPSQPSVSPPPPTGRDAGPPRAIACGAKSCSTSSEACCIARASRCIERNGECSGWYLACSGSASCRPGTVCCLNFNYENAKCVPADDCSGAFDTPGNGAANGVPICGSDAECSTGMQCVTDPWGVGLNVCRRGAGEEDAGGR